MSNVERPKYKVLSSSGNIEIRQYAPMIIAKVAIEGEKKKAIKTGFRVLADYISGNNTLQQDIAMTAPVQQQKNIHIAMTAPVQQQSIGNAWDISFVMPSQYTISHLPKPNNKHVIIEEVPAQQFIVITFSGTSSENNMKKHEKQLMQYVAANNVPIKGKPLYAFYNPPWTLPFMKRNEVMLAVER